MLTSYSLYRTRSATDSARPSTNGVAASSTNTYYSDVWVSAFDWGLTAFTTGTLTGTWTLWATDNPNPGLADDTDWVDISAHADFAGKVNPAGAATKWKIYTILIRSGKLRLKYVNAGGTGNIFAYTTLM